MKRFRKVCEQTYLYGFSLLGKEELDYTKIIADPWPTNERLDIHELQKWIHHKKTNLWGDPYFNSFEWIRDLKNSEDSTVRVQIRDIIMLWIHMYSRVFTANWKQVQWHPDVLGYRLWNWLSLFDFYGASGSDSFKRILSKSLSQQFYHLIRCFNDDPDLLVQLRALKGIIGFLPIITENRRRFLRFQSTVEHVVLQQFLSDGGHMSRSPAIQLLVLRDLIDIRNVFSKNHIESEILTQCIQQAASIVRMFRHGDGTLARFHGCDTRQRFVPKTISPGFIDMCLSLADTVRRPPTYAEHMGYVRCVNKTGILLLSTKPSDVDSFGSRLFGFEWSYDRQVILRNCDLVIENQDQTYLQVDFDEQPQVKRTMNDAFIFLDMHHTKKDVQIMRRLYLDDEQTNLRGEEEILAPHAGFVAVRFQLHPDVEVLPDSKTSKNVILKLNPSNIGGTKISRITTLQFMAARCSELLYQPNTHTIVLLAALDPGKSVTLKWAMMLNH